MNKSFYNDKCEIANYKLGKSINKTGSHGKIYKIDDDKLLKRFMVPWDKYDLDMFKRYMELELDNFYKIYELLYNKKNKLSGYTMEYCHNTDIDIVNMDTEYLLDSFDKIVKSSDKLASMGIVIDDLVPTNLIYESDKMVVIDIDNYYVNDTISTDNIKTVNRHKLKLLLYNMLKASLYDLYWKDYLKRYLDNLEELYNTGNITDVMKTLSKYKRPYDYLNKTR